MKTSLRLVAALLALAPAAGSAEPSASAAESALLARLQTLYPATRFTGVTTTPVDGLYEVVMGRNVAYVHADGRYFLFGHLWDMQTQRDLTASRASAARSHEREGARIDFSALPLADAIHSVHGKGTRAIAVFSDPACPHCKRLDVALAALDDVSIYTFVLPFQGRAHAAAIWCAPDRVQAWTAFMRRGDATSLAAQPNCIHPLERNLALAKRLGIQGTPTIVAADGRVRAGAASAAEIDAWLAAVPTQPTTTEEGSR